MKLARVGSLFCLLGAACTAEIGASAPGGAGDPTGALPDSGRGGAAGAPGTTTGTGGASGASGASSGAGGSAMADAGADSQSTGGAAGSRADAGRDATVDASRPDVGREGGAGSNLPDGGPRTTFYVDGRQLRDPCGQAVVLRGINKMLVYTDRSCASCAEIARTGANSIRMMWFTAVALAQAETAINNAVTSGLIPILEMHDATCEWGAAVDSIVSFWVRPESVTFIQKHQAHLIVNIANEAGGGESATTFRTYYAGAVQRMRAAGIHVPLMIDANNCGRNGELLLSVAQGLLADDPDHNLLFSMHWYDSGTAQNARVTAVMQDSVTRNVPFLIGEFSNVGVPECTPTVPYKLILSEAQRLGVGYLPWEWGPGNQDCNSGSGSVMDMTTSSTFATLQPGWATEVTSTEAASIKNTSVRSAFIAGGGAVCH